jgi:hypothetical protein
MTSNEKIGNISMLWDRGLRMPIDVIDEDPYRTKQKSQIAEWQIKLLKKIFILQIVFRFIDNK